MSREGARLDLLQGEPRFRGVAVPAKSEKARRVSATANDTAQFRPLLPQQRNSEADVQSFSGCFSLLSDGEAVKKSVAAGLSQIVLAATA